MGCAAAPAAALQQRGATDENNSLIQRQNHTSQKIAPKRGLSRRARSIIRQNIIISLGAILFLIISALAEKINLTAGLIGHEDSTVAVVLKRSAIVAFGSS